MEKSPVNVPYKNNKDDDGQNSSRYNGTLIKRGRDKGKKRQNRQKRKVCLKILANHDGFLSLIKKRFLLKAYIANTTHITKVTLHILKLVCIKFDENFHVMGCILGAASHHDTCET